MKLRITPAANSRLCSSSSLTAPRAPLCSTCLNFQRQPRRRSFSTGNTHRYERTLPSREGSWTDVLRTTRKLMAANAADATPISERASMDPFKLVAGEMKFLAKNLQAMLGSGHPSLDAIAKYYASAEGKHFRPLLVLLMSRATASAKKRQREFAFVSDELTTTNFTPSNILKDLNPSFRSAGDLGNSGDVDILPSQRRLAEVVELIHTASLLHDDVLDEATSRRSNLSANLAFGNKMTVLAGDFLLGRASAMLARLRNPEVIELIATVIANLVEGEFMQLRNTALDSQNPAWSEDVLTYYLNKTYLKTASLISKSCRAAAVLGSATGEVVEAAYLYGKNLGLAFQLVDDMLDYTAAEEELGKPAGADLELGLATAPLLFAWKTESELGELVGRKFSREGDVSRARELVRRTDGIEQTRALAQEYADKAIEALQIMPDSESKDALTEMTVKVMSRRK